MKKFILIFTLVFSFFITNINVSAEEISINVSSKTFEDFYEIYVNNERLYDHFMNIFNNQTEYKYYAIEFYSAGSNYFYNTHFRMFNDLSYTLSANNHYISITSDSYNVIKGYHGDFYSADSNSGGGSLNFQIGNGIYGLIDTNVDFILSGANYNITGLYDSTIKINSGDKIPSLKDLSNTEIRDKYINGLASYTEVNLDNYEYVILNLKDYNKKAFETNLKVKGMIGITPVYEFGTIEKNKITDRCNISYDDFTNYRFFVLENDLLNNAVYVVKKCQNNSGFKFDSTIFDITYVTAENVDDPVITFGGKDYHTIPFKQLSNTANKNEEENFVPGESGSSLSDIVDNISNFSQDIWKAVSSFMGLVTKFFNTLPEEFRYLSITAFTTLVFISIIKFIKS